MSQDAGLEFTSVTRLKKNCLANEHRLVDTINISLGLVRKIMLNGPGIFSDANNEIPDFWCRLSRVMGTLVRIIDT